MDSISRRLLKTLFIFLSVALPLSCGTQTTYYLEPPPTAYNEPKYNTAYDEAYFDFSCRSEGDQSSISGDFKYNGTAIYYKIYNNYSVMDSNNSTLDSLNDSKNEADAAQRMISLGYQQLGTDDGTREPLIGSGGGRVTIRLTNYHEDITTGQGSSDYKAYIRIGKQHIENKIDDYVPLRRFNNRTFDFGRDEDKVNASVLAKNKNVKNAVPKQDDEAKDVQYSSSFSDSDGNVWYVDLYAVSVGRDNNFTLYYSKVLHLGCVPIDASLDDN